MEQVMLEFLRPIKIAPTKLSPGELEANSKRAKEYSRLKMAQHRAWQKDLTTRIKLQKAAIAALPPELREAASVPDYTPFPLTRQIMTETPPIPGFGEQQRQRLQDSGQSSRRRLGNR
ncbi:hypothetical protein WJX73_003506 [Symbiochloris irregularis]|uniref:Large ribosomal subunit protein mL40 n=1 Tax=Symbiochloris irregularis TaxID=706552 RepID=A0AAW1PDV3_9CHLO